MVETAQSLNSWVSKHRQSITSMLFISVVLVMVLIVYKQQLQSTSSPITVGTSGEEFEVERASHTSPSHHSKSHPSKPIKSPPHNSHKPHKPHHKQPGIGTQPKHHKPSKHPKPPPVKEVDVVTEPTPVSDDTPTVTTPNCAMMDGGVCTGCNDGYTLDSVGHLCYPTSGLTDTSSPDPVIPYVVPFCWRSMSMAPHTLTSCTGDHTELIASLCYVPCNEGYASDAGSVTTCSQACGDNAESTGFATCMGTPFNYRCDPCGAWAVCADCGPYHTSTGACLCTAKSWTRDWYDRGVGTIPGCPATQVQAGALCYDPCPTGFQEDITPLQCKMSTCPAERPYYCGGPGGAACTVDSTACWSAIKNMVVNTLIAIGNIASDIVSAGGAAALTEAEKSVTLADILPRLQDIISIAKQIVADAQIAQQALDQAYAQGTTSAEAYRQYHADIASSIAGLASIAVIDIAADIDPTGLVNMALSFVFPDCGDADSFGWKLFMEFLNKIAPIVS